MITGEDLVYSIERIIQDHGLMGMIVANIDCKPSVSPPLTAH